MKIKSYQNYLFDLDGTLLNTAELIFQTFLHICKKYADITIDRSRVLKDIGQPLARQIQLYLGEQENGRLSVILDDFRDYQLDIHGDYLSVFPGALETLSELQRRGAGLAVVTSRKLETTELYLKQFGLYDLFRVIVTPEMTQQHKPDPAPAEKALEMLKARAEESLFVGDAYFDIACGNQAGMDTAFVSWSHNDPTAVRPEPTFVLRRMTDLLHTEAAPHGQTTRVLN